jgi:hypothetical protein
MVLRAPTSDQLIPLLGSFLQEHSKVRAGWKHTLATDKRLFVQLLAPALKGWRRRFDLVATI